MKSDMKSRIDPCSRKTTGKPEWSRQSGFSLLEVMIAVLVLAIGLLGLSALQAQGLRSSSSAHQRSQAVVLAYDMMERLRADFRNATNLSYNRALDDALPAAGTLPTEEIINWITTIRALLPAADGAIVCDATGNCTITVRWDDSRGGGTGVDQFEFTSQI